jgi:hypothetical protein
VAGAPAHVAFMAAQAGTEIGLEDGIGDGDGLGEGLGDGLGEGVGVGLAEGDVDGLEWATAGPLAEQPATASRTPMSTNPLLTPG